MRPRHIEVRAPSWIIAELRGKSLQERDVSAGRSLDFFAIGLEPGWRQWLDTGAPPGQQEMRAVGPLNAEMVADMIR
jgi:hypothetical protein